MQVNNRSSVSFRSHYIVQGKPEALAEVASALQTKRKLPESKFDFMAVRLMGYKPLDMSKLPTLEGAARLLGLKSKAKEEMSPALYQAAVSITGKKSTDAALLEKMNDSALLIGGDAQKQKSIIDLSPVSPAVMRMLGFAKQEESDAFDLVSTGEDKDKLVAKMSFLVRDSLPSLSPLEMASRLIEGIKEADKCMTGGRPILDLNLGALKEGLSPKKLDDVNVLQANDVLESLKRGTFDVVEGTFKE